MKWLFVCENGHNSVRERDDYRPCDQDRYNGHWMVECGEIVYCWHELSEKEPDNMSESLRAITCCGELLDRALSEAESVWVDNKSYLQQEMTELKNVIRRALDVIPDAKREV